MHLKQDDAISTSNDKPQKLVDHFIYFGSNISSTKSDVNIRKGKALIAIDKLSTFKKSNLFDKIKGEFFQTAAVSVQLYGSTKKRLKEKPEESYTRMLHVVLNKSWKQHSIKQ